MSFNDVYEGAATYGRIKTVITSIIGLIVGIVVLWFGIKTRSKPEKYTGYVNATITKPDCVNNTVTYSNKVSTIINCILDIKYTVNDKEYTAQLNTSGQIYNPNQTISIRYDPNNPNDITISKTNKFIGNLLLSVGLVIIIVSGIAWYLTQKSKFAASLVAANDVTDLFRR